MRFEANKTKKKESRERFFITNTLPFDDYSRYFAPRFDPEAKKERHWKQFPLDCTRAFDLGARLVRQKK